VAFNKEIKRLDKSNINLTITIPKEDVRSQYQDMLKDYSKNIQIPGFRKGKVPQDVLERKYADALRQEALGRIIEDALKDVFKDENLPRNEKPLPYCTPELQNEPKFDLEQDLQFSVVYDVLPEVKIGSWKGLNVEYPYAEVSDEDINRELDAIRERNAIVMDRDDNAEAKKGDVVTIDYMIFDETGQSSKDLQREDFVFTLGSNTNIYQFDDDIIGMKKGETKKFEKKFADDHADHYIAGKTVNIQITLTALKEKKIPDLDDDLAQDVDEKFKTLDDLKNDIRKKLERNLERKLREVKTSELLKKIMENTHVVIPESMIKAEIEGRFRQLAQYYNTSAQIMMQMMTSGEGHEEREKRWRETAEKALHSRLIIETLIEEQNFDIKDEDIEKEIEVIASENNVEADEVRKHYDDQAFMYLKEEIKERRVIDMMMAENTFKSEKKENYLEFMTDNS